MRIGLFSLQQSIGCTSMAIHLANYLAADGFKVALVEKQGDEFLTVKADFAEDKTFEINDVHFYPRACGIEPTEDYIIEDIGKVGILYKFDDYDKIYLCSDGSAEDYEGLMSLKDDNPSLAPDIVLFGASKDCVRKWSADGFRTILIGKKREAHLPQNFIMAFSLFLRLKGLVPPTYHADKVYAPIVFGDKVLTFEEEKEESSSAVATVSENDALKDAEPAPKARRSFLSIPKPQDKPKEEVSEDIPAEKAASEPVLETPAPKATESQTISLPDLPDDEDDEPKKKDKKRLSFKVPSITLPKISIAKKNKALDEDEASEEEPYSSSLLMEEPMQGVDFSFDELIESKDLSEYAIFKNKRFVCFGLKKNVRKHHYDNTDGTLVKFNNINDTVIQFMSADLLSGEYTLKRFESDEVSAMKGYFSFICSIFSREIGKTATLREYVEFKQYYNQLCETKLILDDEKRMRLRRIHELYLRYVDYAELYNIDDILSEQSLVDDDTDSFIKHLKYILDEHVSDEVVKEVIKGLIGEFEELKPKKEAPVTKALEPALDDTITLDEEFGSEDTSDEVMSNELNTSYKIKVACFDENGNIEDSAIYALSNIDRAASAYIQKEAFKKVLSLKLNDVITPLFSSKNGGVIISIPGEFNEDVLKIRDAISALMAKYSM